MSAAHLNPFYFREHSKRIMRGALFNDSKFLADINVMDYSLVVGVDSRNNELVVGIVGTCVRHSYRDCTNSFPRLYSHVYVGQKTGELGEGFRFPRWRRQ